MNRKVLLAVIISLVVLTTGACVPTVSQMDYIMTRGDTFFAGTVNFRSENHIFTTEITVDINGYIYGGKANKRFWAWVWFDDPYPYPLECVQQLVLDEKGHAEVSCHGDYNNMYLFGATPENTDFGFSYRKDRPWITFVEK